MNGRSGDDDAPFGTTRFLSGACTGREALEARGRVAGSGIDASAVSIGVAMTVSIGLGAGVGTTGAGCSAAGVLSGLARAPAKRTPNPPTTSEMHATASSASLFPRGFALSASGETDRRAADA